MEVRSVTIGLPVSDLDRAVAWYQRALGLGEPELTPAEGVVEFRLGPIWLQLGRDRVARSGAEAVTRLGVADAASERERLIGCGVAVGPLVHVPDAVDFVEFLDPDGNRLSLYSEVS